MAFIIPEEMQKLYDHLKAHHHPKYGELNFFDLSQEPFVIHRFSSGQEWETERMLSEFVVAKKAFAITWYKTEEEGPILSFDGVTFVKVESLETGKIVHFREITPAPSLEDVIRELKMLKKELEDKAS